MFLVVTVLAASSRRCREDLHKSTLAPLVSGCKGVREAGSGVSASDGGGAGGGGVVLCFALPARDAAGGEGVPGGVALLVDAAQESPEPALTTCGSLLAA
jgi:hypothetical protein